jgi:hypothetical protein
VTRRRTWSQRLAPNTLSTGRSTVTYTTSCGHLIASAAASDTAVSTGTASLEMDATAVHMCLKPVGSVDTYQIT